MKRLCIYFFYDKDGIVDDYVPVYLQAMREFFSEICVVVNGKLTQGSEQKLKTVSNKLIIRDNVGFDSWAYKEALYSYGLDKIACDYDEVLLNNFTCFGPIGSFKPMFNRMDKSVCDFWGHCRYYPSQRQMVNGIPVPEHLMSYFILFKKNILTSLAWKEYWETLQPITNYDEARLNHEFRLTPYFEKRGFISDAFVSEERSHQIAGRNSSVHNVYGELLHDSSPLLKRKALFAQKGTWRFYTPFSRYNRLLYYIAKHHLYDFHLMFDNLIRTGDFTFSKNKMSILRKIKWTFLGDILGMKSAKLKLACNPDFGFIRKMLEIK